jgi:fatty-acyl-CoA synthase
MLEGLMQHDHPLTLQHVLWRMRTMNGHKEVVTLTDGEPERISYAALGERVDRLCHALTALGVKPGDRVATFSWNTQRHLELYLAAPCMGAVLHTLNIRLFPEQLQYIVDHAEDHLLFLDPSLHDVWDAGGAKVDRIVELGDEYEQLLAEQPDGGFDYPELDDRSAAGLCYTSGTTGNPKGVLYSHRSNVLHTMGQCLADGAGVRHGDCVLPIVPMFHANAWGFPYAATMIGASLVLPSRFVAPEPLARAIERERVTIAAAVPTVWLDLLRYADEHKPDLSSLRMVPCGGAAVPESLMRAFEERHGVRIVQAWGMTETSPLASTAHGEEWDDRVRQGRSLPLVETRIVDDAGEEVAWDGESTGELEVRGPWIAAAYYRDDDPAKFDNGWLRTGDIAAIDPHGSIKLTDRSKDVIKSGGEWISSVELENALMAHASIREAAVIARPDERWSERPLACVVLEEGAQLDAEELKRHLHELVAKWWVPDDYVAIDEVPKTSVGKFDKKVLRAQLKAGELTGAAV